MSKVCIALPAFGRTNCTETTMSLMALPPALASRGISYCFTTQSSSEIDELRNMILTLWYDLLLDYGHLLMIDADMGFEPELVLDMLDLDQPLVACLYPRKTHPIGFVGKFKPDPLPINDGFVDVAGAGAGVMLIRRDCVAAMLEKGAALSDDRVATHGSRQTMAEWGVTRLIRAFDKIETPTGRLSEDYSFCRRHTDCGGTVWAASHHRITHVGQYGFSGRFLDTMNEPMPGDA